MRMQRIESEMVARGGIEPPTRGFSGAEPAHWARASGRLRSFVNGGLFEATVVAPYRQNHGSSSAPMQVA